MTLRTALIVCLSLFGFGAAGEPPPGHERRLFVPQLEGLEAGEVGAPAIDGALDDAVWQHVASTGGFWNSLRGRPPPVQTEVLVIGDEKHLYIGFRLHDEQPESLQATRKVRDGGLGFDDTITVELDTFFNRRDISSFSVNPLGTQDDSIAGGRSSKIEWKGDWRGAARRTNYGWSAEFAIPLAILNYREGATIFGVNFRRYHSRAREYSYWADVTPQNLPERMGRLEGLVLSPPEDMKAWSLLSYALAGRNVRDQNGDVDSTYYTAGIDARYQPRPNLTAVLSLNPDFTTIEQAFADISFSYAEKALAENRPFFAEGAGYFSDTDHYFYSNRVPDFDYGAKTFGRTGRGQFGLLAARSDDRTDFVARSRLEFGDTGSATGMLVGTLRPDFDNLLAVGQVQGRQRSGFTYALDAAVSRTEPGTVQLAGGGEGAHYRGALGWQWDHGSVQVLRDHYDIDYFPANARLAADLSGTKGTTAEAGYYREASGSFWRILEGYVAASRRDTASGELQREKIGAGVSMEFVNDVRVELNVEEGPYRPVGAVPGSFQEIVHDDTYYSAALDFNTRSNRSSWGVLYEWGDFAGAPYEYALAHGWWRPSNAVAVNLSLERLESLGLSHQVTVGSSWDMTPEHSLSGRYIYREGDRFYRLAYAHRPRRGLDIVLIYDAGSAQADELFLKIVRAF